MIEEFQSRFVSELPGDTEAANNTRQVLKACFSRVTPTPVSSPRVIAYSHEMTQLLELQPSNMGATLMAEVASGNKLLPGMQPHAACYGGHQFGGWAGQLGDGRAISLGEKRGRDGKLWELQLKGAGPTPYSRSADGRAVMRSSVREFLCSEAMFHLGVPTTRALSLVATGDHVLRDILYDGHPRHEPGAIVCRVAPSFIRFGNFEIFASRGDTETLRTLTNFTLRHHFPHLLTPKMRSSEEDPGSEEIARFFEEVCFLTAQMVVEWMRVGFVHGVMNTDNMSILGLTIDYGPYGWLEDFDPTWTPNTTDASGRRYRFGSQPRVCEWNLVQLANALLPLVNETEPFEKALGKFAEQLHALETQMMANKLGLRGLSVDSTEGSRTPTEDKKLVEGLHEMLTLVETDMTIFYRSLAQVEMSGEALRNSSIDKLSAPLTNAYYSPRLITPEQRTQIDAWLRGYLRRTLQEQREPQERIDSMNRVNPKFVLRNYLAQEVIDEAEKGNGEPIMHLLEVLRNPYAEQEGEEHFSQKRPEWARSRVGCSMLSCSS